MKRHWLIVLCAAAAIIGLGIGAFFYHAAHHSSSTDSKAVGAVTNLASYTPTAGKPGTKTIQVLLSENKIVGSNTFTVNKNDAVHLEFSGGNDQEEGDILLQGYDLTVPTTKNYTTSMEFKALKTGSFPIKLTYEDESREIAEQHDEILGSTEASKMHSAIIGTFIVK